jgi:hypothetical protein
MSEALFTALKEHQISHEQSDDSWLIIINSGFSQADAVALQEDGRAEFSIQMGMLTGRLTRAQALAAARADEREECAKVADRIGSEIAADEGLSPLDTSMAIAAAITSRSKVGNNERG